MIDCICLTFEGVVDKGGLGTNYTLEVVAEDMGDASDHHEGYHHCHYAHIDESQQTPASVDHFLASEKIEYMRGNYSQKQHQGGQQDDPKYTLHYVYSIIENIVQVGLTEDINCCFDFSQELGGLGDGLQIGVGVCGYIGGGGDEGHT